MAVGAQPNWFGIPGVEEHGLFLKEAEDSAKLHARLLNNLERAAALSYQGDKYQAEIDRLLKVVVVGGGPTGKKCGCGCSYGCVATYERGGHDLSRTWPRTVGDGRGPSPKMPPWTWPWPSRYERVRDCRCGRGRRPMALAVSATAAVNGAVWLRPRPCR